MELDRPAALAALWQLLECCKIGRNGCRLRRPLLHSKGFARRFSGRPNQGAFADTPGMQNHSAKPPLRYTLLGFCPPSAQFQCARPITESWLAEGDNAWQIVAHLAPIVQVNNDQRAPVTIWESWPSLEAIRLLSNKIRQTIAELEQQCRRLPLEAKEDTAAAAPWPPEMEARGAWMYTQAMQNVAYGTIRRRLQKKSRKWPQGLDSDNGVKKAIIAYANRHSLPEPGPRKAGSPKQTNTN